MNNNIEDRLPAESLFVGQPESLHLENLLHDVAPYAIPAVGIPFSS